MRICGNCWYCFKCKNDGITYCFFSYKKSVSIFSVCENYCER